MKNHPSLRATNREREDTVEVLRTAFAAGCLDSTELANRTGRAYAAVTREELSCLVHDLPSGLDPATTPWPDLAPCKSKHTLGWEFSMMLAVAGAWLLIATVHGAIAVPFILLWLVALRALGVLPRPVRRAGESRDRKF
jgi:hypothetical protein